MTNKTIRIRSFTSDDLHVVVDMYSTNMLHYTDANEHSDTLRIAWRNLIHQWANDDRVHLERVYFGSGGHFWVATSIENDQEIVVGTVGLEGKPDKSYELRRLTVHPHYRRYGIGKMLVRHLEQWAKDHGVVKVWLSTGGPMLPAQAFYLKLGYIQTKVEVIWEDPYFEAIFYEKVLD